MNVMHPSIENIYKELQEETQWLHIKWLCYRQLFAASPKRIDMLNECSPVFFYIVERILFNAVLMDLSKLTDPARVGRNENLSLEQLQEKLQHNGDSALASQNRLILEKLCKQCAPFREWRNKSLAHLDFDLTTKKLSQNTLPGVSRELIENALSTLREYLNAIEQHYNKNEKGYEHDFAHSDVNELLHTIRTGLRYEELFQGGAIPYDDWIKGKWHDA